MINLKQARNDNTLCRNVKMQKVLQSTRKSLCFKCFTFISHSYFTLIFRYFTLRKKCSYPELFWSAFSCIRTEYGEIRSISPYSVQMQENADQNNSEYEHFSRSDTLPNRCKFEIQLCKWYKKNYYQKTSECNKLCQTKKIHQNLWNTLNLYHCENWKDSLKV